MPSASDLLGDRRRVLVTGGAGFIGGAVVQEAIYSLLMMQDDFIAASAHIEELDPDFADMPIVQETRESAGLNCILSNSFGFGGTNGSLVMKRV